MLNRLENIIAAAGTHLRRRRPTIQRKKVSKSGLEKIELNTSVTL